MSIGAREDDDQHCAPSLLRRSEQDRSQKVKLRAAAHGRRTFCSGCSQQVRRAIHLEPDQFKRHAPRILTSTSSVTAPCKRRRIGPVGLLFDSFDNHTTRLRQCDSLVPDMPAVYNLIPSRGCSPVPRTPRNEGGRQPFHCHWLITCVKAPCLVAALFRFDNVVGPSCVI